MYHGILRDGIQAKREMKDRETHETIRLNCAYTNRRQHWQESRSLPESVAHEGKHSCLRRSLRRSLRRRIRKVSGNGFSEVKPSGQTGSGYGQPSSSTADSLDVQAGKTLSRILNQFLAKIACTSCLENSLWDSASANLPRSATVSISIGVFSTPKPPSRSEPMAT